MQKSAKEILNYPFNMQKLIFVFKGCIVGIITGIIVGIFRSIIDKTMKLLYIIYPYLVHHSILIIPYAIAMIVISLILGFIIRPQLLYVRGSGVPQIEAQMEGKIKMPWWPVLWRKFVGGLLAICPGLFLGREGPCIQMGACVGQGLSETIFHSNPNEKRILVSCGIASGLSAAFSAPIAGTLFLLEEITFSFSPLIWLTALAASISSDIITLIFFGITPCLHFVYNFSIPLNQYWQLIILGIILGLFGYLYQIVILNLPIWYSKIKFIPQAWHSVIPLLLVIFIGLYYSKILGGSHNFILDITNKNFINNLSKSLPEVSFLAVLLLIRFVFSMISYGASVPGGIFMPILVLGATSGALYASIMIHLNLLSKAYFLNIIIYSMAAYFGAIEKAPFTAVILISEMIGSIKHMLPLLIVTIIAYLINDWLGGRPIYGALEETMDFTKSPAAQTFSEWFHSLKKENN